MIKQIHWRIAGGAAILIGLIMVVAGTQLESLRASLLGFSIYWGIVVLLVAIALYCALLDIRFIRVQYTVSRRELFQETIGEERFRRRITGREEGSSEEKNES